MSKPSLPCRPPSSNYVDGIQFEVLENKDLYQKNLLVLTCK